MGEERIYDDAVQQQITLPFLELLRIDERTFEPSTSTTSSLLDCIIAPALGRLHIRGSFLGHSLSDFLQHSPRIWALSLPYSQEDVSLTNTMAYLRHCPSLMILYLLSYHGEQRMDRRSKWDVNTLLRGFIDEGEVGVLCPLLRHFSRTGQINFSVQHCSCFSVESTARVRLQTSCHLGSECSLVLGA